MLKLLLRDDSPPSIPSAAVTIFPLPLIVMSLYISITCDNSTFSVILITSPSFAPLTASNKLALSSGTLIVAALLIPGTKSKARSTIAKSKAIFTVLLILSPPLFCLNSPIILS